MNKEQERLLNMRREHKISESDYLMLANALNKKSTYWGIENSLLVNPFQKIAGFKALILGLVLMVVMSVVGSYANVYYDGALAFIFPLGIKTSVAPSFFLLLYQNLVICLTLSILFLVSSFVCRQKRIRYIDFFGTVFLSRYPLFISLLFTMIHKFLDPKPFNEDISQGFELHLSLIGTVSNLIFLACIIWQIMTYFYALKEASGLDGKKLWGSFIACMLLGDIIAMTLSRFFLYT
ncbi:hypothetical protein [Legionella drancourtii]|uniref:Yip1 domain-containing protein n=1 Tax=Legionella drancourtii LLAP12 TaxID=658187 RepID=G9EIM4_9GAMM|nr:hypothetical protein [Legionella drancourtii]EHL32792.1 hypothetical protein LDG_5030 [Legionella drancourtii LLAP12]